MDADTMHETCKVETHGNKISPPFIGDVEVVPSGSTDGAKKPFNEQIQWEKRDLTIGASLILISMLLLIAQQHILFFG